MQPSKINLHYFNLWRKRGEGATSAANLARGSEAIANDLVEVREESDDFNCQCDYGDYRCKECIDYRRRTHEDLKTVNRRHKCQCRYTLQLTAKSADGAYVVHLGGVCVDDLNDSYHYLERCAAELACEVLDQMQPTPDSWLAL
ncbi:MAG: hypothetical protein E6Q36_01225 [Chryseobacterium sp.]|nr:MAG: hypothetical protein E6Q36_01225 [Chryseobacterium sp.]